MTENQGKEARMQRYDVKEIFATSSHILEGYDDIDVFKTPKEFIADVLCDPGPIEISDSIAEHGHMWDIFQENYIDSKGVDVLQLYEFIFSCRCL